MATATKDFLRKEFLAKRSSLDENVRQRQSSMIRQRIFQHPAWTTATTILCYVSFGSEVDTHALIQEGLRYKKKIVIPIHDGIAHGTPLSQISRFGELSASHRGILQVAPEFRQTVDPAQVELALIPGIAFDKSGVRLGFGGGYFDKLLPQMKKATRVALAFEDQMSSSSLPRENHDVTMDFIVTEKAVYKMASPI